MAWRVRVSGHRRRNRGGFGSHWVEGHTRDGRLSNDEAIALFKAFDAQEKLRKDKELRDSSLQVDQYRGQSP